MNFKKYLYESRTDNIVYHVTYYKNLPGIATHGLIPNQEPNQWGRAMNVWSRNKIFFSTNLDATHYWITYLVNTAHLYSDDVVEDGMIPIVIRFRFNRRGRWATDKHSDYGRDDYYTHKEINPYNIEWWDGKKWKNISDDSIDIDLFFESGTEFWEFKQNYPFPK